MKQEATIYCPKCGEDSGGHQAPIEQLGQGVLILFLSGLFPFRAYYGTRKKMIKCERCEFVFLPAAQAANGAPIGGILFLLLGVLVAVLIGWFLFLK